jgi:hypothetical protein
MLALQMTELVSEERLERAWRQPVERTRRPTWHPASGPVTMVAKKSSLSSTLAVIRQLAAPGP